MNNLLSQLTEVQKSINPNYIPSEEPRYITVIKQLEARNKSSVRKEYSKSNPLSGMVEDLVDAGVLQDKDARFLSDKEIRALHEKMHDGILEAAGMGHFEPAEEMADEMLSDEVQMASNGVCRQDTGDGVDYIEDGLGMSEFDEVQMAEPKEGQKKPIFGRMYEYRSGKWTPAEGGATTEEPKEEKPTAEEPMDDDITEEYETEMAKLERRLDAGGLTPSERDKLQNKYDQLKAEYDEYIGDDDKALSAMVEEKGAMIDEMLAGGMSPEEIADELGKEDTDIPSNERIDAEIEAHAVLSDDPEFREYAESTLGRSMTDEEFDEYTANYISDMSDEEIGDLGIWSGYGKKISDEEIRDREDKKKR